MKHKENMVISAKHMFWHITWWTTGDLGHKNDEAYRKMLASPSTMEIFVRWIVDVCVCMFENEVYHHIPPNGSFDRNNDDQAMDGMGYPGAVRGTWWMYPGLNASSTLPWHNIIPSGNQT